jgi:glycosyltransferase involved in cell wall biosynthesis
VEDLIRSMNDFKSKDGIALIIVGNGPELNRLKNLAISLGLDKCVLFKGFVNYKQVPYYMNSFDVAVDFSLIPMEVNGQKKYASFSQKIPQYLSCGVPVIAWETRDTIFLKNENIGDVVPVGKHGNISKLVKKYIFKSNLEECQIRQKCRKFAEKEFAAEVLAARRMELWQQIESHGN